ALLPEDVDHAAVRVAIVLWAIRPQRIAVTRCRAAAVEAPTPRMRGLHLGVVIELNRDVGGPGRSGEPPQLYIVLASGDVRVRNRAGRHWLGTGRVILYWHVVEPDLRDIASPPQRLDIARREAQAVVPG